MLALLTIGVSISNAFNAIYVKAVDTKHIHTFLPITFLIFNRFSIWKKVLENWELGLSNNTMYVDAVDISYDILYKI